MHHIREASPGGLFHLVDGRGGRGPGNVRDFLQVYGAFDRKVVLVLGQGTPQLPVWSCVCDKSRAWGLELRVVRVVSVTRGAGGMCGQSKKTAKWGHVWTEREDN